MTGASVVIAIDPGRDTGWSRFRVDENVSGMVRNYRLEICGLGEPTFLPGADVIVELPQIYTARQSKGDPNDLVPVVLQVGRLQERAKWTESRFSYVLPAEWKGQVPKPVHERRIRAKLSADELRVLDSVLTHLPKGVRHNVVDAVGLGLYRVGRRA